jgi:hypothetical protein
MDLYTFDPYHRETVPLKNYMDPHKKTGCKFARIWTSNYKKQQLTVFFFISIRSMQSLFGLILYVQYPLRRCLFCTLLSQEMVHSHKIRRRFYHKDINIQTWLSPTEFFLLD